MHTILAEQIGMATGASGEPDLARLLALVDAAYCRRDREVEELRRRAGQLSRQLRDETSERERAAAEVAEQTLRFRIALDYMSQGLCFFDAGQRLLLSNRRYAEVYGLLPEQIRPGMTLREIVALRATAGSDPAIPFEEYVSQVPSIDSINSPTGKVVQLRNGRSIAIRHQPMQDGSYVATHEDVTERCAAEARIVHMAHHDALTGLPNRVLFRDRLQQALAGVERGQNCAVLCVDLDYFKTVNDTLGHPLGDALLSAVTERLRRSVRKSDTVARVGGDEFAIVQFGVHDASNASNLAERLVCDLAVPFDIGGHQVVIGSSIGIALAPIDGTDPDQLMKSADLALYSAKVQGRGRFSFFKPEMASLMEQRRMLELELRLALGAREFHLMYQPLVEAGTARVRGFEALLRWNSPRRGAVAVSEFLPLAEEIGLIVPIGEWVLAEACAEAARWGEDMRLAVNISAEQFKSGTLPGAIVAALQKSGLPAHRLELEITETAIIQDPEATRVALLRLKGLGVSIALDDFGTGYSSLSHLREFAFDRIKIDRSFVRELTRRRDSIAFVRALVGLCGSLGIGITAEGVETEEQLAILSAERCDEMQGYLFGHPCSAAELPALVDSIAECRRGAGSFASLFAELPG